MGSSTFLLGVRIKSFNNFFVFINYVYYMEVTDRSSGLINVIIVKAKKIFEDIFAHDSRVGGGENLFTEDIFLSKDLWGNSHHLRIFSHAILAWGRGDKFLKEEIPSQRIILHAFLPPPPPHARIASFRIFFRPKERISSKKE